MNIGSKEVFQQSNGSSGEYVTNGLIAWFDGIWNAGIGQHDSSSATWKDLAGNGFDLTLRKASFNDNCLVLGSLNATNDWAAQASKPLPFNSNNNYYEIAVYTPSTLANANYGILTGGGIGPDGASQCAALLYALASYQRIGPCTGNPCTLYRIGTNYTIPAGNYRYAFDHDFQMKDLEIAKEVSVKDVGLTSVHTYSKFTVFLSGNVSSAGRFPNGVKLYALRIYDHRLSEAERTVNYNLDAERFKL